MDEILKSDHSNTESYWAVRPYETVYYAVQGGFNICDWEWHAKAASIFYTAYQTDHNLQGWALARDQLYSSAILFGHNFFHDQNSL